MTSVIILGFLAGALFVYGLPHLVSGVTGKTLATPLGDSPTINVGWGWVSWVIAVLLWHAAPMRQHPRAAFVAVAAGILIVGWAMGAGMLKARRR